MKASWRKEKLTPIFRHLTHPWWRICSRGICWTWSRWCSLAVGSTGPSRDLSQLGFAPQFH
jgi:hypothetical protein